MTKQTMVKMVLDAWDVRVKEADTVFDQLTDEQLKHEVAPNRNRGIYLLGHLTAVNDRMLPLLGLGERLNPSLDETFIGNPDKSKPQTVSASELRQTWKKVNLTLAEYFSRLKPEEWFQKHNSVSEEDFQKEPHRNRLNIVLSRTSHLAYHVGQLTLLKTKKPMAVLN